jgi:DNA-binding NarL/FixJ family response regulator
VRTPGGAPADPTEETLIQTAPAPPAGLTDRQQRALQLLSEGWTDDAAARRLGCSARTYRRELVRVVAELNASCRIHAVALAAAHGVITVSAPGTPQ